MDRSNLIRLCSQCPPQQAITFLLMRTGVDPQQIANHHSATSLRELLRFLQAPDRGDPAPLQNSESGWLDILLQNMDRKLGEFVENKALRERYSDLLELAVGETNLKQYFGGTPLDDIARWCGATEDLLLVAEAEQGDQDAFQQLWERHERQIFGFVRSRVDDDHDVKDITQNAWIKVWQKLSQFDPRRGSLSMFLKYWAGIELLHHFKEKQQREKVLSLFSELSRLFSHIGDEVEVRDVLERINAQPQKESDQSRSCAGLLNELISRAFGGMHAPHQKLVFGFVRLLEWKPCEVVEELTDVPLGSLLERMANDLVEQGGLPAGIVEDALSELHSIMQQGLKFVDVVKDPKTAATYPRMSCRIVRDTTLREYYKSRSESPGYNKQSSADVVAWWSTIQRWLLNDLLQDGKGSLDNWLT